MKKINLLIITLLLSILIILTSCGNEINYTSSNNSVNGELNLNDQYNTKKYISANIGIEISHIFYADELIRNSYNTPTRMKEYEDESVVVIGTVLEIYETYLTLNGRTDVYDINDNEIFITCNIEDSISYLSSNDLVVIRGVYNQLEFGLVEINYGSILYTFA